MNPKSKSVVALALVCAIALAYFELRESKDSKTEIENNSEELANQYKEYLENHPFRKTTRLSKEDRKQIGLPPNKFYEQEWLYTSDPELLRPAPEKVHDLQERIAKNPDMKSPPGTGVNAWVERGPNNVGGRTHSLMFAPGSTTKVFAGSVSGGLWINDNITSSSSQWYQASGVPGNLAVMCMTVDPNDSDTMYIGTGEVYTWGAVNGNGVYKSTDGGNTWTNIYSGGTSAEDKITYVQDIIAWNNPSTNQTEIFFGVDAMAYTEEVESGSGGSGWTWLGANTIGLYRSTDGTNFSRLTGSLYESSTGDYYAPNDFDIDASGNLWMGTKYSYYTGEGGGVVFRNTGTGWTNVRDLGTNGRVELACSQQDASKIYVLVEDRVNTTNPAKIYRTNNAFSTAPSLMALPNDADTGISSADFTRGQSFYDLMIGVDPLNDAIVYVGGIDLFKSTNSAASWSQFSHWYGGFGYQEVHADQHGIAFATQTGSSTSRLIFGNDGGVYYTNNGGSTTSARNNEYNVTQFYKGAINQQTSTDKLLAGSQDNGSHLINNAGPGIGSSTEVTGGDGCWVFIDQDNQYMISSYVYNTYYRLNYTTGVQQATIASNTNDGDFVNQCGLDSDANILYANGTSGTDYQIYRYSNITGSASRTTLDNAMIDGVPTAFVASPFTNNRILVGTSLGTLIRLDNANATPTWNNISIPGQVGAISDIRYGETENDILVTFHNYGVVSIWYSSDGGSNWSSKEGDLPDMPVKCILQNPLLTSEVIIGTELGVWQTSNWGDASPNWTQSQNGMSDVKVLSFDFRTGDNTILAATFGRGMFTGTFEGPPVPVSCSTNVTTLPYGESFETGLGLWSQASGDDGDWVSFSGSTPSSDTGPTAASDGSQYLYIEASSNGTTGEIGANAQAILNGPCIDMSSFTDILVEFDYHTYGTDIGSITLQGSINEGSWFNLFSTPGVSADAWITETVDLSSYNDNMKLRIIGATGNGWSSDLAIDNIVIRVGCSTSTTYNGSWSPSTPTDSAEVTIASNYNTSSGSIEACELIVANGATLTIGADEYVRVKGDITVESGGTLLIEHEGSLVQVNDDATVTNNGTINVNLTTPNLASRDFMVMGSPMTAETRESAWSSAFLVLEAITPNFVPHPDVESLFPGAENFADDNNDFWNAVASGTITPGEGYIVRPQAGYGQPGGVFNYTYDGGTLNTGNINFSVIQNTPGPTAADDKNASPNVLANPYPSAIFADDFISANAMIDELYFWEHLTPPSPSLPGAGNMNFSMEDISVYNLSGGTAAASDLSGTDTMPNGYIATGQGFGIKATAAGTAVFTNTMRRTDNNNTLRSSEQKERMWINITTSEYSMQKQALLAFNSNATENMDPGYDTRRLATVVSLYTHLQDGTEQLGIQTLGQFDTSKRVALGYSTLIDADTEYKISIADIEGPQLSDSEVYLVDNITGLVHDLRADSYGYVSGKGTFDNRFTIYFDRVLGTESTVLETISLFPNPTNGQLNIASPNAMIENVVVFDMMGRKVTEMNGQGRNTVQLDLSSLTSSVYFVNVSTETGTLTKRIIKK